jgi:hypothetical protein
MLQSRPPPVNSASFAMKPTALPLRVTLPPPKPIVARNMKPSCCSKPSSGGASVVPWASGKKGPGGALAAGTHSASAVQRSPAPHGGLHAEMHWPC